MAPTLHMFCGKIASGKSTLAAQIAREGAILIAEDVWLDGLFGDQITTGADYFRCSAQLRGAMGPHVASLLNAGLSVALDFAANTVEQRQWMRQIFAQTGADHRLHVLDFSDETCLARLADRNAAGEHPFEVTEDQFRRFARHFARPTAREGFNLIEHSPKTS